MPYLGAAVVLGKPVENQVTVNSTQEIDDAAVREAIEEAGYALRG